MAISPSFGLEVSLWGGLNYANPSTRIGGQDLKWTGTGAPLWGMLVSHPVEILPFEIESGVLVQNERIERPDGTGTAVQSGQFLQVPVLLRYRLDPNFGFGFGGYWAAPQPAGASNPDSGLIFSARAHLRIEPWLGLAVDARYQHGLANRALVVGDRYETRNVQFLAGIEILLLE